MLYPQRPLRLQYHTVTTALATTLQSKEKPANEHICIAHGHRQQCGEGWGEVEGAGWRGEKGEGKWSTSVIVSTILKKERKACSMMT